MEDRDTLSLRSEADAGAREAARGASDLPAPPTPLIGRRAELAHAERALRDGARLLSVVGPDGIGKTRLAVELARRFQGQLRVAFVPLAAVAETAAVEPAVAAALDLDPERPLVEQLDEAPRLVVLDAFDHVADAAPLLADALAARDRLQLVVTSRAPLHLATEETVPLPPLDRDEGAALFFRHAAALGAELDEDSDRQTVAAIGACLDGLPLAIELAAARSTVFEPAALLERLTQRLEALSGSPAAASEETMSAAVDWSVDLLSADELAAVEGLAVFSGGASLPAAAAVCGTGVEELARTLASLGEKRLVEEIPGEPGRFRMPDVVRERALDRTRGTEAGTAVRARHLAFFRRLVEEADERMTSAEQEQTIALLEREHDNIRAALAQALDADPDSAMRIAAGLRSFWRIHGHFREGCRWLEEVLARADASDPEAVSKLWNGLGILQAERGELAAARTSFAESLRLAREAGQPTLVARATSNLGNLALYHGDHAEARRLYTEAIEINRSVGNLQLVATALRNLGATLLCEGKVDEAFAPFEESLELDERTGAPHALAHSLRGYARALVLADQPREAAEHIGRSLDLCVQLEDANGAAQSLEAIAGLAARLESREAAQQAFALGRLLRRGVGSDRSPDEVVWLRMAGFQPPPFLFPLEESELELADAARRGHDLLALLVAGIDAEGGER